MLGRAYGSIPHLFASNAGGDKFINIEKHRIATEKARDKHDLVIVQEKADGGNCAVLKKDGVLLPLVRSGHLCSSSEYLQHRIFHDWVMMHYNKFEFLKEGERLCGEWMIQAHGTVYDIRHPFVVFDIIKDGGEDRKGGYRLNYHDFMERLPSCFTTPKVLNMGGPCSISEAMLKLGNLGYLRAVEETEGAVWRVERDGKIDFLAKYLRRPPDTIGRYLGEGKKEVWNLDIKSFMKELPWEL